jgi:hypothetical protein
VEFEENPVAEHHVQLTKSCSVVVRTLYFALGMSPVQILSRGSAVVLFSPSRQMCE